LMGSMCLMLEEFYNNLKVSLSCHDVYIHQS
jgi:hypothetical protein